MKRNCIILLSFLLSLTLYSSELDGLDQEKFEQLHREFLSHNPNDERKVLVYLIAGQEFLYLQDYENAKRFYQLAINTKGDEDKTQAFIDLSLIANLQGDEKKAREYIQQLNTYLKANQKFQNETLKKYIAELENYLSDEPQHRAQVMGHLRQSAREKNFTQAMKEHDYLLALSSINLDRVPESGIVMQTKVDLLRSLVRGPNNQELFCAPTFKKHPKAFSYTMMICSLLHDYQAKRPLNKQKLSELKSYFENNHQQEAYLLKLIDKLGGPRP